MDATLWAAVLAPILGPLIWWALLKPGRGLNDWLWRKMPEGRLRSILLRRI